MMKNLKIKIRLYLLVSLVIFSFVLIYLTSYLYLGKIQSEAEGLFIGSLEHIDKIAILQNEYQSDIPNIISKIDHGLLTPAQATEAIRNAQEKGLSAWNKYLTTPAFMSDENTPAWQSIKERIELGRKEVDVFIGKFTNFLSSPEGANKTKTQFAEAYTNLTPFLNSLQQLFDLHIKEANHDYEELQQDIHSFLLYSSLIQLAAILAVIIISYVIIKSIVGPLQYAVDHVNSLAEGDLSKDINLTEGGEPGYLLRSVKNMIDSTNKMAAALNAISVGDLTTSAPTRSTKDTLGLTLNSMMHKMRLMISELKEGITALTSSTQEMSTSISQLSAGATETAAAVSETSSTTEELKQTVQLSTEKAKDVLASVDATLQTVKTSEKSVLATIEGMNQINERMQAISDGILKLSEKSLAIGEIMNTMNDLAEQSNLLAVNAAIEATKAGEQGRSFGVVAQEIRTLAEQSKSATVQVRSLLNEIQSATNAAVLATEQGSKAVAKGVERSNQTNEAIKVVVGNMSIMTQAANQIVISSQQQLIGVDQVNSAVVNINEATNQLVDQLGQIKTAVTSLNKVGNSIQDMVNQYKLTSGDKVRPQKFEHAVNT